jgi:methylase of polypeptide subunit release factors
MMTMTLGGKLYLAPVPKEQKLHRVADLGTGTGIWAIDFGMLLCYQQLIS